MAMGCFPQASEPLYATIKVSPGMSDLVAEDPWLTLWGQMTRICIRIWHVYASANEAIIGLSFDFLDPQEQISVIFGSKYNHFHTGK